MLHRKFFVGFVRCSTVTVTVFVLMVLHVSAGISTIDVSTNDLETVSPASKAAVKDTTTLNNIKTHKTQIGLEDLMRECPQVLGRAVRADLSEQCLEVLDSYFLDRRYVPFGGFLWLKLSDLISYRRIFENPSQDRNLVLFALQRPECQFKTGDTIRPDLVDSCDAESFTAYASFNQICGRLLGALTPWQFDVDWTEFRKLNDSNKADWLDEVLLARATNDEGVLSIRQHARLKEKLFESSFHHRFLRRKCDEHDLDTLMLDPMNRDRESYYDLVTNISKQLGMPIGLMSSRLMKVLTIQALYRIAAHLGDETASLLYNREGRSFRLAYTEDSSLIARTHELFPWMKYFFDAGSIWDFGSDVAADPNPEEGFTKFLSRNIRGLVALDEAGVKYDLEMLVDQVCRRTPFFIRNSRSEKIVSCQSAIDSLRSEENWRVQEVMMLEAFERTARELGVVESQSLYEEASNPFTQF